MRIHTNVFALHARRHPVVSEQRLQRAAERPSAGLRGSHAAERADGPGRSEHLHAHLTRLRTASEHTQTAMSFVQAAAAAMREVDDVLQELRAQVVAAGNLDVTDEAARGAAQAEIDVRVAEIDRIAADRRFANLHLLDGSVAKDPAVFQVGADPDQWMQVAIAAVDAATLGVDNLDVSSRDPADTAAALDAVDAAIAVTSASLAEIGETSERLGAMVRTVATTIGEVKGRQGQIRDTDMALEAIAQTRNVVMISTGTAVLLQAQRVPDAALELLGLPP